MGYLQIILLSVLSLSIVRSDLVQDAGDTVQDGLDTAQDLTDTKANTYSTRCQICTITTKDNGQQHKYDDQGLQTVTGVCPEYVCQTGMDWCLVTYYEHRASVNVPYDEIRQYQCGTKALRDGKQICRDLHTDKNSNSADYERVQECITKRSSGTAANYSLFTMALLLAFKLLFVN